MLTLVMTEVTPVESGSFPKIAITFGEFDSFVAERSKRGVRRAEKGLAGQIVIQKHRRIPTDLQPEALLEVHAVPARAAEFSLDDKTLTEFELPALA
jgi:hypothetical protein